MKVRNSLFSYTTASKVTLATASALLSATTFVFANGQPLMTDKSFQDPASVTGSVGGVGPIGGMTGPNIFPLVTSEDPLERTYGQSHWNEAFPTKVISSGESAPFDIPYASNFDTTNAEFLDIAVNDYQYFNADYGVDPSFGEDNIHTMEKMMELTSTDGIMVLKDGVILAEHYRNGFESTTRHNAFSMTKSFAGMMLSIMIESDDYGIAEDDLVVQYIPELDIDGGAFKDATIREVLDMSTAFVWNEAAVLTDCEQRIADMFYNVSEAEAKAIPTGVDFAVPAGCEQFFDFDARAPQLKTPEYWLNITNGYYPRYPGPQSSKDSLMNLKVDPNVNHGEYFVYRTANTMVLGWIIENLTDDSTSFFSDNFWSNV